MRHTHLATLLIMASLHVMAEPVATVNGTPIDKKELDTAVNIYINNNGGRVQDSPALREQIRDTLITREVLLQEAKRQQLDKQPAFIERMDTIRHDVLREAMLVKLAQRVKIDDDLVKARYNQIAKSLAGTKDVHVSQIFLKSDADAQKVIAELKKGAKFDILAKSRSLDPAAKQTAGDMGWGNLSQMDPLLADVLKPLTKGQYNQKPLQTPQGWHIFKLNDIRDAKIPALDELKAQITRQLQDEAIAKEVTHLRAKAKIQ